MDEPLKALEQLGAQFERLAHAAASTPPRRRRGQARWRVLALVVPGVLVVAGAAMAASAILAGAPVRNPPGVTFQKTVGVGKPVRSTLLDLRVADPGGGPPWGIRMVTTTRGFGCVQVGRVVAGRLGVLGQDGAFADDGRFHELPADVLTLAYCQQPDAAGHLFIAVAARSLPSSALDRGCAVAQPPPLPAAMAKRPGVPKPPVVAMCPAADVRTLDFGLLGPHATSVVYEDDGGRAVKTRVSRPAGAYLVVQRPSARRPATLEFSVGRSPSSGLRSVRYEDAPRCAIASARRLGGARRCPLVGFVSLQPMHVTAAQVGTPVRATFAPRPVRALVSPSGVRPPREWRLTVVFRGRHAGDARSNYEISIRPRRRADCDYTSIDPVIHDVRPGEVLRETAYLPAACHGVISGTVVFRPQSARAAQSPPLPDLRGSVLVGHFEARIPG